MDVTIIQKPVYASMTCEHCCGEIEIPYDEFVEDESDIYSMEGYEFECPTCGEINIIEDITFD